jgi:aryl-alcohol dehydrogenase-like predicted oxidoreductase
MTTTTMRSLGKGGPHVHPIALGCMGMSGAYGKSDDAESVATIHAALDAGVTLFDTGDYYGAGHNELLLGRALAGRRDRAIISVKFGALRGPRGAWIGFDARPAAMKNFLQYSLVRLGVDHIDVYRPGRLDPNVPIEEIIGAMAEMVQAGYVRHIGLSEVGPETIRRAHKVHPICDLQIEYSLVSRGPEQQIFPVLDELGIAITAYGVLSRGLLAGSHPSPHDARQHFPRFAPDNQAKNQPLVDALARMARERGATPVQLATAWVLHKRPNLIATMGARTRAQLADVLGATAISLSAADIAALEAAVPAERVAGERYNAEAMRTLDSEP